MEVTSLLQNMVRHQFCVTASMSRNTVTAVCANSCHAKHKLYATSPCQSKYWHNMLCIVVGDLVQSKQTPIMEFYWHTSAGGKDPNCGQLC